MITRDDEIAQYATAVRAALDDLPEADREELVDDLEDHLAEVAAESKEPLTVRLGTPEAYAAELRAAYGADGGRAKRSLRMSALANLDILDRRVKEELENHRYLRQAWDFLGELRPAWWLLRGYLAALLLWYVWDRDWHAQPWGFSQLVLAIALVLGSAVLGIRARDSQGSQKLKRLLVGANVLAVLGIFFLWWQVGTAVFNVSYAEASSNPSEPLESVIVAPDGDSPIANIYPYSKDGKPLKDVLLYDQNGRPVQLNYEGQGFVLQQPCGSPPPIANSYPLPLKTDDGLDPTPACVPTSPTPAPHPSPSPSPSPSPTKTG